MSGQWTPCPSPINSQFARCAGVASDSRHDHASGTLITRPSTRWAVIVSSLTSTWSIRDSTLTAVFIPGLYNQRFVHHNETTNLVEFSWTESMIPRQFDRRQPEFGVLPIAADMDVHGLVAIKTVEEEPVRPRNAGNPWHSARLHARSSQALANPPSPANIRAEPAAASTLPAKYCRSDPCTFKPILPVSSTRLSGA